MSHLVASAAVLNLLVFQSHYLDALLFDIAFPGGYYNFFCIRRLGPSIFCSPQKNIRNFKYPKKYFKF